MFLSPTLNAAVKANKRAFGCFKIAEKPKVEKKKAPKKTKTLKKAAAAKNPKSPKKARCFIRTNTQLFKRKRQYLLI